MSGIVPSTPKSTKKRPLEEGEDFMVSASKRAKTTMTPSKPLATPNFSRLAARTAKNEKNVTVSVRVRRIGDAMGPKKSVVVSGDTQIQLYHNGKESEFSFDFTAGEETDQDQIFQRVCKPLVDSSLERYNGCILAYGQTGSGKTFTMVGDSDHKGMIPRVVEYLLQHSIPKRFKLSVSMIEIYNEQIFDLLKLENKPQVNLSSESVQITNIASMPIDTPFNAKQCLATGTANRKKRDNGINADSSRSHALFIVRLHFEDTSTPVTLMLVDLAGSEASNDSNSVGDARKEASNINKSLSNLSALIQDLVQKGDSFKYRTSKLTSCLRDCLGGNSKVAFIATVNPDIECTQQTLSTLTFVTTAKGMKVTTTRLPMATSASSYLTNGKCNRCADLELTLNDAIYRNSELDDENKFMQTEMTLLQTSHETEIGKFRDAASKQEDTHRLRIGMLETRCDAKDQRIHQLMEEQRKLRQQGEEEFEQKLALEREVAALQHQLQEREQYIVSRAARIAELEQALKEAQDEAASPHDDRHEDLISAESQIRQLEARVAEQEKQNAREIRLRDNHIEELKRNFAQVKELLNKQQQENMKFKSTKNVEAMTKERQLAALKEEFAESKANEVRLTRNLKEANPTTLYTEKKMAKAFGPDKVNPVRTASPKRDSPAKALPRTRLQRTRAATEKVLVEKSK